VVIFARDLRAIAQNKIWVLTVLRGEIFFFEGIYLAFLGEEGKKKEMAMAVAVVKAVNKYRQIGVLGRNI
jgi:hypothetical protein